MARQRPDHAGHRIDVDRGAVQAEPGFQNGVGPADVGAEHKNPGHRHEQAGNGERQQREIVKQRAARRIGALDRPGDEAADREAHDGGAERINQRIGEQPQDARAAIGFDKVIERPGAEAHAGIVGECGQEQRRERHQHQPRAGNDAADQEIIRPPPADNGIARRAEARGFVGGCHASGPASPSS